MSRGSTREHLPMDPGRAGCVWRYRSRPDRPQRVRLHRHDELELNLVVAGTAQYHVDGHVMSIARGDGLILWPRHVHGLVSESPEFAMWIVVVAPRLLAALCTTEHTGLLRDPSGPAYPLLWQVDHTAGQWLDSRLAELALSADDALHAAGLMHVLLAAYATAHLPPPASDSARCAKDAARLLDEGAWDWTVPRLARAVGVSPSTLSRSFRATYHQSVVEYRHQAQVARACEIFGAGNRTTLADAAALAGFGSYAQFHRVFSRLRGCSPREHARRVARGDLVTQP